MGASASRIPRSNKPVAEGGGPETLWLEPFDPSHAEVVLSWSDSAEERNAWASLADPDPTPDVFRSWHAPESVHPYLLFADDEPVGYGEVWEDAEEDEAELARIIVAPSRRGRGIGRAFVRLLAARAEAAGFDEIWVRIVPSNAPALACYRASGFSRATSEQEDEFNRGQPRSYVWMRLDPRAG